MKSKINYVSRSRRNFIRNTGCAALGGTTFLSTLLNLRTLGASSIFNSSVADGGQYKALVCLLFSGGNDSFNMLIPTDTNEYNAYATSRGNLAVPSNEIIGINANNVGARSFGVHPAMPKTAQLFNDGKMSFISNVGSLIQPTTKSDYYNGLVDVPLGLYSHADQIMHWQTGIPHDRVSTGWGGKMADLMQACNANSNISMCLSMSGTNVWQTGNNTTEFAMDNTNGAVTIWGDNDDWLVNTVRKEALDNMLDANYSDLFMDGYKGVVKTSRTVGQELIAAIETAPAFNVPFNTSFRLSKDFEMVAKAISVQSTLNMDRQIFFIEYGGWDAHDDLLNDHPAMLATVDDALHSFNAAMEQLGLSDQVTTFGLSEFGRTLTSNGDGSDHGWGGNVFAMGGAVNGTSIFGDYPLLDLGGNLEVGGGVFIPTTSADEYFAEIALWFGVPESELTTLFPNLGNFYSPGSGNPIGFLNI